MLTFPGDEADALDWLTFEQAGVVTTAQATRLLTEGVVRGMVRSGRWRPSAEAFCSPATAG
ncbi:hypothetical protein [Micromonospora sp. L32]|uniref:hypothetical protein n=1 Tax=Micromonospora TaxID=1873 RepID=UPI003F8A90CE